jgi:hypothetical protein
MNNYILYLSLTDTDLTRTVSLPEKLSFYDLHNVIQIVFGWEDEHLHEFNVNNRRIVPGEYGGTSAGYGDKLKFAEDINLDLILKNVKSFNYNYDFGDDWHVEIKVLGVKSDGYEYPQLVEFTGGMAKEDCGGTDCLMQKRRRKVKQGEINAILKETFDI